MPNNNEVAKDPKPALAVIAPQVVATSAVGPEAEKGNDTVVASADPVSTADDNVAAAATGSDLDAWSGDDADDWADEERFDVPIYDDEGVYHEGCAAPCHCPCHAMAADSDAGAIYEDAPMGDAGNDGAATAIAPPLVE